MSRTNQEKNKALVLEAFDTLFNKRDYVAAERLRRWAGREPAPRRKYVATSAGQNRFPAGDRIALILSNLGK